MPKIDSLMSRVSALNRQRGLLLTALLALGGAASAQQLSGTYYVGTSTSPDPTRTYPDLSAAMTALGGGVSTSTSVTFTLLDASYALGTNALVVPTVTLSAGQGVSIMPAAGVSPVISGSSTTALIDLNGTDFLTISGYDGSTSARTLTLRNTASAPAVLLRNDATSNTLRNLIIESANTSSTSGTVLFSLSTGTTGNDLNTIANCDVRAVNNSATTVPANAIYSLGTATATNSDNTIRGCSIYNFSAAGVYLNNTGNGGNWTVGGLTAADGNQLYQTATRSGDIRCIRLTSGDGQVVSNNHAYQTTGTLGGAFYGVAVVGGGGHTITNNYIGGSAASAGGSALVVIGTGFLYGFYLSLGGTTASTVQGNTVANIAATTTGTSYGVDLLGTTTANVTGNTFGSATGTGFTAVGPLYGVLVEGSAAGTISGNTVGGLSNTTGTLAGLSASSTGAVVMSTNGITNLTQTGTTSNLYGIQNNSVTGSNVTGNTITNITYSGTSTGQTVYGIFAGGSNTISTNTITTVQATGTANANVRGIYVGGAGAAATVSGNIVSNVLNATSGAATSTAGIFVGPTSGVMGVVMVSGNRISNVGTSATTPPTGGTNAYVVTGLLCGASAAGSVIERNRVWNVYGSSTGTGANADQVRGLAVQGTYSGTFANNQISLAAGTLTQQTYGIQDLSSGGTNSFYYNSVYLAPASAAAASSYGFWRSATATPPTVDVRNNLLYNARTAAAGATAHAIGTASTTGWAATTSNYNLLVNATAATVGNWGGTALSFAGWKAAQAAGSGGDASSLSVSPTEAPAANLFTSLATGNLDINAANPEAWYVNGNGVQLTGQTADFGSAGTGRATTVAAGGTDIGADDVTPTSTPPALAVSGAPALGGTQVFSLGGRTLASLTYGAVGTVPSLVVARYYSGTNPLTPFAAGARYANVYFTFSDANADGSGYSYQPTLMYDPALLGTIASEPAQRISQRLANNSGYQSYSAATVDPVARTVAGPAQLTRLGLLAISDLAAPLPVTLTSFSAFRRDANVELDWVTASEKNCAGYEIQVATDGKSFRKLGFVNAGAPNSTTPQFYQFLDEETGKSGVRYYRLRQLDLDGQATYSPVQSVSFGDTKTAGLLAYPNPFGAALSVAVSAPFSGQIPVTLTDAMGRTVFSQLMAPAAGTNRLELAELAALPAGVYLLHLALPGQPQHLKVVKN